MTKKRIRITDGGVALPLGNNTFLMRGRLHSQGGIGIGNDIEVEDREIVKFNKDNIQVLSDQPMLNGTSPANAFLAGGNFNKIFKAQQSINGNYGGSYAEDGSEKEIKKENIPTKEEYITQKLDSIRNNALERSRNKTNKETTIVAEADVYGRKYMINRLQEDYNIAKYFYDKILQQSYSEYKKDNPIISEKYTLLDEVNNKEYLQDFEKKLKDAKSALDDAKNGKYDGYYLNNCIANLSEFYPHGLPYGNQTFKANPKKYGFSLIDTWDVKPGDLIQHIEYGVPAHAMIYNGIDEKGKHTFNYSDGGSPYMKEGIMYGGYGTNKHYPNAVSNDGKHLWDVDVYRYTGTPQDSIQWSNEYDQKYGKTLKNGGQINMKLKHKNKQDITDIVMNEILPHSTGERKKFFTGGFWANIGTNALNSLLQGIVTPILNYKMADEIEKSGKDLQPTQMSKNYLDSRDYTREQQLGLIDSEMNKLAEVSSKNTSNSKTHINRMRQYSLEGIRQKNKVYGESFAREQAIKNENARMAQEVDKINITNKNQFALVNEQNRLDRQAAAMRGRMAGDKAALDSTENLLHGIGTAFSDWDKIGLTLLNSENPNAWNLLNKHFGKSWKINK